MPIVISKDIPAFSALKQENIFVMSDERAFTQDIRPLEIAILNLMPTKEETETQFMRLLSNSPLQVNVTLVYTESYKSKNTAAAHLERFYKRFEDIKDKHFDGMIITGAPVETMPFEEVAYWDELKKIFDFAEKNVTSTIYICWGAQAALYYYYGIEKHLLPTKLFGVFPHKKILDQHDPLSHRCQAGAHICGGGRFAHAAFSRCNDNYFTHANTSDSEYLSPERRFGRSVIHS